jgi:hypothetical protein
MVRRRQCPSRGRGIGVVVVGDSVIVLGREDLSSTLLSQRMRVGGTRLEDAVPVGVGNGSATWVDDDGVLFIVAQQEGATQSRLYYSPDQGESWLRAPTLLPRGSVLGGGGARGASSRGRTSADAVSEAATAGARRYRKHGSSWHFPWE